MQFVPDPLGHRLEGYLERLSGEQVGDVMQQTRLALARLGLVDPATLGGRQLAGHDRYQQEGEQHQQHARVPHREGVAGLGEEEVEGKERC